MLVFEKDGDKSHFFLEIPKSRLIHAELKRAAEKEISQRLSRGQIGI